MLSCDTRGTPMSLNRALAAIAARILQALAKRREPNTEMCMG
jgi:hypothetical protein